jgi:crotonobetainyl-CoA:carnitine CoA-transferase CaiB-like acyl-CoA transferase
VDERISPAPAMPPARPTARTPVRFSQTPGTLRTAAPALGEHTDAVLAEAGLGTAEISRRRTAGIVA